MQICCCDNLDNASYDIDTRTVTDLTADDNASSDFDTRTITDLTADDVSSTASPASSFYDIAQNINLDSFMDDSDLHRIFSHLIRTHSRNISLLGFQPQHTYPISRDDNMLARIASVYDVTSGDVVFAPIN